MFKVGDKFIVLCDYVKTGAYINYTLTKGQILEICGTSYNGKYFEINIDGDGISFVDHWLQYLIDDSVLKLYSEVKNA